MSAEVWVYAGNVEGSLDKTCFELLGKGRELADALGTKLVAVLLGHNVKDLAQELIDHGADRVLVGDDGALATSLPQIYAEIVAEQIKVGKPDVFLFSGKSFDRDVAARVAIRVGTGLISDCIDVGIDKEQKLVLPAKPISDDIMGTFVCTRAKPQMVSVSPGALKPAAKAKRIGEVSTFPVRVKPGGAKITRKKIDDKADCRLEDAALIVAGGRGVGGKQGFDLLQELAVQLGGQVACTQGPVEAGFAPHDRMVGQSGKTVKPKLYIACGISGAVQHTAGMWDSQAILSINNDPEAPIFGISDFGVVGECAEVVPALIQEIERLRKR